MSTSVPPHLKTRVLDAMSKAPSPDRAAVRARALRAWGVGVAFSMVVFAAVGVSLGQRPLPFIAATAAGWALVAGVATYGAYGRGGSMLGRSRPLLVLVVALTAPALVAWLFACLSVWPGAGVAPGTASVNVACFSATMGLSWVQ